MKDLMERSINFRLGKIKKVGRNVPADISKILETPKPEDLEIIEPKKTDEEKAKEKKAAAAKARRAKRAAVKAEAVQSEAINE